MQNSAAAPTLLDITRETCPMTFVRTRLALDGLPSGAVLRVTLRGSEPLKNVTRSTESLGHTLLSTENGPDGTHILTIRKH
ncbi:sulfurtransferase TusA family protein [Acetobacter conturbans]|uniref:Sulfurtransferase TusA family protein n=1 Tax=Acetobacter conturbans TaxID=1737472 RepID=A0ABX0JZ55_9PROT|nr:sulfurtransferase TusA family protein [Acetobacter conturbans]NHN87831.1 sulfurtransferase TusA family protein [Acetobacter conturbans]